MWSSFIAYSLKIEGQHSLNYNLSFEVEAFLGLDMIDAFLWHAKTKRQRLANVNRLIGFRRVASMTTFYLTGLKILKQIKIIHQSLTGVHLNVSYLLHFLSLCVNDKYPIIIIPR